MIAQHGKMINSRIAQQGEISKTGFEQYDKIATEI